MAVMTSWIFTIHEFSSKMADSLMTNGKVSGKKLVWHKQRYAKVFVDLHRQKFLGLQTNSLEMDVCDLGCQTLSKTFLNCGGIWERFWPGHCIRNQRGLHESHCHCCCCCCCCHPCHVQEHQTSPWININYSQLSWNVAQPCWICSAIFFSFLFCNS